MDHGIAALQWYKDDGSGGYTGITYDGSDSAIPSEMIMQPGNINCNDNHWGGACQPSQLGIVGWGNFLSGSGSHQHLYSVTGEGASVTPNITLNDNVVSAPSVATNTGQQQLVTTEGNYYPEYLNTTPVQETITYKVRVFDRQGSSGKAFSFITRRVHNGKKHLY